MLKLHHLNNSRSTRIIWLLEELGVDYELVSYQRQADKLAPAALKKAHPLGRAPILEDEQDGEHISLAESGAIIEYLIETYDHSGTLRPNPGTKAWRDTIFWLHFAEGSAMPPLVMQLVFSEINNRAPKLMRFMTKAISKQVRQSFIKPNIQNNLVLIEQTLSHNAWFAGDKLTGADIQMSFVIEALAVRADEFDMPHALAWLDKVRARKAYQNALEKGGALKLG
ncbi:glutathione S-transferase [Suttonella sp. R2A3]|uniref:glutathione S-transferase n=1 Tax=Suttonella sp. R2A3 TaxID=2908648 RepID=UPI001F38CAE8|nr:glutathione S-transferase [Suttonella sp. R2A3]UJF25154.1 glutathione S-transferase [Suttonella sp. R2A3]